MGRVQGPTHMAYQLRTKIYKTTLTCMYSMRPSSGGSLFAVTLEAGNAFGATLNSTFRRELVITREPIETKPY